MSITIYHNPACSTSRKTLALLQQNGIEPQIIHYLDAPPSRDTLIALIAAINLPLRELMRSKESLYESLKLNDPSLSDDVLIDAILSHPVLLNRPIVVTPLGARLCRPVESVLDILPASEP